MQTHVQELRPCAMCRVLKVNHAGDSAWLKSPRSGRAREDARLLGLIRHQWLASGGVYGHRRVTKGSAACWRALQPASRPSPDACGRSARAGRLRAHSTSPRPIPCGPATSHSSGRMKVGCIWQSYWICFPDKSSVGRCGIEPTGIWSCRRSWRRSGGANPDPACWFTRTRGRSTSVTIGRRFCLPMAWCAA